MTAVPATLMQAGVQHCVMIQLLAPGAASRTVFVQPADYPGAADIVYMWLNDISWPLGGVPVVNEAPIPLPD